MTVTSQVTSGTLPAGLTMSISGNKLTISGTPTAAGNVSFTVTATDSNSSQVTQDYTLTVNTTAITLTPSTLPSGSAGTPYNQSITAGGGNGTLSLTYSLTSGGIPAGLNFNVSGHTLTISGTPTSSGTVRFTVTASDPNGDKQIQNYTLTVNAQPISLSPTTLPPASANTAYNQTITASGGSGTVTVDYTVTSGTIPTGLNFTKNGNKLTISGTPTTAGTVSFTVTAVDTSGDNATQNYTLTVNSAAITFSPASLPSGTVNSIYSQTITASGGTGTVTVDYNITSGSIPTGLNFVKNGNQLTISGTPAIPGSVSFTVTATDSDSNQQTKNYTLTVNAAGATITLSPNTLPSGTTGTAYSQAITASGGNGTVTVTYSISSGGIPAGLNFNTSGNTLTISGTPTASGSVSFTVTASDTSGDNATHNYTLTISSSVSPPSPPPSPPAPPTTFATTTSIVSTQTTYVGLTQVETVVAQVTNAFGIPISQGFVTFQLNGQTVLAPVSNGMAVVTVASGLLDPSLLFDLFFPHALSLNYNDVTGIFGASGDSVNVPPILLDFFLYEISLRMAALTQSLTV